MMDNSELDDVQKQIAQLKAENLKKPPEAQVAGMHLVFSMGFTVLGALYMGDQFGRYLSLKAGNPQYGLVGWVLGLGLAIFAVYGLLRPYMK